MNTQTRTRLEAQSSAMTGSSVVGQRTLARLPSIVAELLVLASLWQGGCTPPPTEVEGTSTPAPTGPTPPLYDASCDAGEEAFVARAIPLLWGRKPHGIGEIRLWAESSRTYGRDVVVRAMTGSPDYVARWSDWIMDSLGIARLGDRSYSACFNSPALESDNGELAQFIAGTAAAGASFSEPFNMADVLASSLKADDLSAAWRVNLFSRMNRPLQGANVGPYELEDNRRNAFGDEFFQYYLNRNMTCLGCHNSEWSITGSDDPTQDRTWEVPGLFEKALLGSSFGISEDTSYAVFRYNDLLSGDTAVAQPWGMDVACGVFTPADQLTEDYLDHEGYFVEAFGETGSVWQVEAYLQQGVDSLAESGLMLGSNNEVDGPQAFAWLVGMAIVDQVWQEALGTRLTISNYFPRNEGQRDRLQSLTATFVEGRYSLRELLVGITTDPLFNQGAPSTCTAQLYGLDPVLDPWTVSDADPARHNNGPGELVHRQSARTLLRSVHDSMGWAQPSRYLANSDPLRTLQLNLGAFMRTSQPGFNGTDFQGILAFENTYGNCASPSTGGAGDGCQETLGYGGCASCNCQACVCATDAYCCDVQWDALCVSMCNEGCGGCGGGLASTQQDTISRLLDAARANNATVGEVVVALKDRLTARGPIGAEEQQLIEALLQEPLDQPLASAPDLEPALRVLCGALLISPDYLLATDPAPVGEVPSLTLDLAADCQRMQTLLASVGVTASCEGGTNP
jgi:hypothetical protein